MEEIFGAQTAGDVAMKEKNKKMAREQFFYLTKDATK